MSTQSVATGPSLDPPPPDDDPEDPLDAPIITRVKAEQEILSKLESVSSYDQLVRYIDEIKGSYPKLSMKIRDAIFFVAFRVFEGSPYNWTYANTLNHIDRGTTNEEIKIKNFRLVVTGSTYLATRFEKGKEITTTLSRAEAEKIYKPTFLHIIRMLGHTTLHIPTGDPGDFSEPPSVLQSKVYAKYQQGFKPYCMAYSFASALHYLGFELAAETIANAAKLISTLPPDKAAKQISWMLTFTAPVIAGHTIFGMRTGSGNRRPLHINDVLAEKNRFPFLLVPKGDQGTMTHAICVIDDLIFNAISPKALRLCPRSLHWIFNVDISEIALGFKFETKINESGQRTKEKYTYQYTPHFGETGRKLPKAKNPLPTSTKPRKKQKRNKK